MKIKQTLIAAVVAGGLAVSSAGFAANMDLTRVVIEQGGKHIPAYVLEKDAKKIGRAIKEGHSVKLFKCYGGSTDHGNGTGNGSGSVSATCN